MKRVLVCGDRNWKDKKRIEEELLKSCKEFDIFSPKDIVVIEGGAKGVDSLAGEVAKELGFRLLVYPAEWEKFGKMAGPLRNIEMLEDGKPDLVLAFHADLSKSKGTAHMVKIAKKKGIEVKIIGE